MLVFVIVLLIQHCANILVKTIYKDVENFQ